MKLKLPKTARDINKEDFIDDVINMISLGVSTTGEGLTGLGANQSLAILEAIRLLESKVGVVIATQAVMNVVYAMGYTRAKEEAIETARNVDPVTVLDNVDANLKRLIG